MYYYQLSLEEYQTICVGSFSFAKGQQAFESIDQSVKSHQDKPKRTSADNSETTQNLNINLYNYQTETAISIATKHE